MEAFKPFAPSLGKMKYQVFGPSFGRMKRGVDEPVWFDSLPRADSLSISSWRWCTLVNVAALVVTFLLVVAILLLALKLVGIIIGDMIGYFWNRTKAVTNFFSLCLRRFFLWHLHHLSQHPTLQLKSMVMFPSTTNRIMRSWSSLFTPASSILSPQNKLLCDCTIFEEYTSMNVPPMISCYIGTVGEYFSADAYSTNAVHVPLNERVLQFTHQQIRVIPSIANPRCYGCRRHRAVCTCPLISPALPSANEYERGVVVASDTPRTITEIAPPPVPSEEAHVGVVEGSNANGDAVPLTIHVSSPFGDDVSIISDGDGGDNGGENAPIHSLHGVADTLPTQEVILTDSSPMLNPPFKRARVAVADEIENEDVLVHHRRRRRRRAIPSVQQPPTVLFSSQLMTLVPIAWMNEEHDFRCRRPILRRSMKRRLDHISCDDSPVNPAHLKRRKVVADEIENEDVLVHHRRRRRRRAIPSVQQPPTVLFSSQLMTLVPIAWMNEEHDFRCRRPILRRSMKRRLDHISCDDSPVNPAHLKRRKVVADEIENEDVLVHHRRRRRRRAIPSVQQPPTVLFSSQLMTLVPIAWMNEEHDFRCRRPILRRSMKRRLDHISCDDSPVNPAHLKRRKVATTRPRPRRHRQAKRQEKAPLFPSQVLITNIIDVGAAQDLASLANDKISISSSSLNNGLVYSAGAASPLPSFEEENVRVPPQNEAAIAVDIAENEDVQFDNDDRVDLLDAGNDVITIDKVEQQNGGGVVLPTTCTRRKTEVERLCTDLDGSYWRAPSQLRRGLDCTLDGGYWGPPVGRRVSIRPT
ncbi:predicted protein [Thalassiosira pseudonana CCMP1335]|uniref:Uncharacterized protein n=1 Tax=Thalassiosira pseudonana TaxID=35128 RepID=B8CD18_THAPS|nr:predicted protein [Thalassiosira pseudonana CCMP1335]EED88529.1 predicted protein [Thalassiosira pseudonana CCMP1335]